MNSDGSTLRSRVVRVIVKPQTTYAKLVSSVERVLGDAASAETRGVLLAVANADGTREQIVASLGDVANLPPHATDLQLCTHPTTSFRYIWAPSSLVGSELIVVCVFALLLANSNNDVIVTTFLRSLCRKRARNFLRYWLRRQRTSQRHQQQQHRLKQYQRMLVVPQQHQQQQQHQ